MGQSFCNQCGSRLDAGGSCGNVACVAYAPPAMATVAAASNPTAPPGAVDPFADAPDPFTDGGFPDGPTRPEPQVLPAVSTADRDWVAAGEASQNEVYLGNRLLFQPPEMVLNGSPEAKILIVALVRWFTMGLLVWPAMLIVTLILAFIIGPKAALVLFFVMGLAYFVVHILLPTRVPISEWMLLLDDKAAGAESAFAQITDAFRRRESPTTPTARRISFRGPTGIGGIASKAAPVRNYLAVQYGHTVGYVSAFGFGNDLYIGWTLWWRQRPIRAFWNSIRQLVAGLLGRDVQFQLTLRADDAKALRELIHSAAREGVDVATRGLTLSLAGTVGGDVPVEAFEPAFEE